MINFKALFHKKKKKKFKALIVQNGGSWYIGGSGEEWQADEFRERDWERKKPPNGLGLLEKFRNFRPLWQLDV